MRASKRAHTQAARARQPRPTTIDEEIVVEKIVPGGRGFARMQDGRAAMVDGGFPGDRVRLRVAADRGTYVEGRAEVVRIGTPRIEAPCPVAARCGGCDWMALPLEAQQRLKLDLVREALRRTAGLTELPQELELVRAGDPLEYRSRIRLQLQRGRVGFFSAGSRELVEIERCLVSSPAVQDALSVLRTHARRHVEALEPFEHVELRAAPGTNRVSLSFSPKRGARVSVATRLVLDELRREFLVSVRGEDELRPAASRDDGDLERFELGGVQLLALPGSFTQVNWAVNRALVDEVVAGAVERSASSFADLYCGIGNFSLPLLHAGLSGKGVEASPTSIACAERAAREQGFTRGAFFAGDVGEVAGSWARAREKYDLVVVDPPRAGAKDALDSVRRLATKAVVLIACDPVTFARDLRSLIEAGLVLESVKAFDMFPQTHHVECLAWLRAASVEPGPGAGQPVSI